MYIKNIKLSNFRNYEKADIDFSDKVNIFVGKNAQGKTNILESIYLSASGSSFRTSKDREMVRFGDDLCRVVTEYENEGSGKIEISIGKDGYKKAKINGKTVSKASDFMDNIYVVVFSPEDLKIVKDEPEKRRNFIDRELCQLSVSYLVDLYNYKKVLLQRNAYLKEERIDENILRIWSDNLIKYGTKIIIERKKFVGRIAEISRKIHAGITAGDEDLFVRYAPNIKAADDPTEQRKIMAEAMEKNLAEDMKLRTTTIGPQRDDIELLVDGINIRKFGSQGQQRTAALALKLAELELIKSEKEVTPVLLLDDVLSELDPERQRYLISSLSGIQLFITATEISEEVSTAFPDGKVLSVENGKMLKL